MTINPSDRPNPDATILIWEVGQLGTQYDIFRFLKRFCTDLGLKCFWVSWMPSLSSTEAAESTIITNFPPELLATYDKNGMLRSSPTLARLQTSTAPFTFDVDLMYEGNKDVRSARARELFHSAGLSRGAIFPVCDASGERAVIILAGDRQAMSVDEIMLAHLVLTHVFDKMHQIRQKDIKTIDSLTMREIDCLTWTSAGKTSSEIAEILKLSEHTVNHYLNRAAKKLNTVNRTQAVAKALRAGIIR